MEEKLKQFIGDQLGISPSELTPEADLTEDLGVGPVEIADLLTNIEAKFGVKIPDEERSKIKTIGQLITKLTNE